MAAIDKAKLIVVGDSGKNENTFIVLVMFINVSYSLTVTTQYDHCYY